MAGNDVRTGSRWKHRRLVAAIGASETQSLGLDLFELRSSQSGPTIAVLAGIHGDETTGIMAAGQLLQKTIPLLRGQLRVVPVCHEAAFYRGTRESPVDSMDLARVFPGDEAGTATQRLAASLREHVLRDADLLIDLHSAGRRYDMPYYVGCLADGSQGGLQSIRAAMAFGAPTVWLHPHFSPGRSTSVLVEQGRPAIYVESAGGESVDKTQVRAYVNGVMRVLGSLEMLRDEDQTSKETLETRHPDPVFVQGAGNLDQNVIRFPTGGLFVREAAPGAVLDAGSRLGSVYDVHGRIVAMPTTASGGVVMFIRKAAAVQPGDVVACLAEPAQQADVDGHLHGALGSRSLTTMHERE